MTLEALRKKIGQATAWIRDNDQPLDPLQPLGRAESGVALDVVAVPVDAAQAHQRVEGQALVVQLGIGHRVFVNEPANVSDYFTSVFEVGYTGDTLMSLEIADAVGVYDYTGLTSFYTVIADSWADAMGLLYTQTVISVQSVAVENTTWTEVMDARNGEKRAAYSSMTTG